MEDDDLSIDSNDENFYGNDYPEDEESAESDDYERDYDNSDYDDDGDVYFRPSRKSKLAKEVKNLSNAVADFILCKYPSLLTFFKSANVYINVKIGYYNFFYRWWWWRRRWR